MTAARKRILIPGARALSYIEYGAPDGTPVFHFHGWPGSARDFAPNAAAAEELGVRVIAADRPGVAGSDRQVGRCSIGPRTSTGSPTGSRSRHPRVSAGSTRPWVTDGMMRPTRFSLGLARREPWAMRPLVALMLRGIERNQEQFGERLGQDMSPPDRALLAARPDVAEAIVAAAVEMARGGSGGALDDALAITRRWGFELAGIASPVAIWQGSEDTNDAAVDARSVPLLRSGW